MQLLEQEQLQRDYMLYGTQWSTSIDIRDRVYHFWLYLPDHPLYHVLYQLYQLFGSNKGV